MPKLRQIKTLFREIVFVNFDLLQIHLGLKHGDAAQKELRQPREESGPQKPADPSTATGSGSDNPTSATAAWSAAIVW